MRYKALLIVLTPGLVWASGPIPIDSSVVDMPPARLDAAQAQVAVMFGFDSATLVAIAKQTLRPLGLASRYDPDKVFVIEGHSDVRGSKNYNLDLSVRRVAAVKDYLIEIGVHPDRIRTRAFGESRAAVNVLAVSEHVKDRRVVVRVEDDGRPT